MSRIRCYFAPRNIVSIEVDEQHLSRLTGTEVREMILQLLIFGGSQLRKDITHWLNGGKLDELGHYISPDNKTDHQPTVSG